VAVAAAAALPSAEVDEMRRRIDAAQRALQQGALSSAETAALKRELALLRAAEARARQAHGAAQRDAQV
jgi:predicted  nucleic acid-binding Zn-ribbon protein